MTVTQTVACALLALSSTAQAQQFRPPAVPLITHDPYFSIWSMADHLNDEATKHWTGKNNSITAFVRIDGKAYQVIGRERPNTATLKQDRVEVLPTRTLAGNQKDFEKIADGGYKFADEGQIRVPLGDWYYTVSGEQHHFQARSVVGGIFIKMLDDPAMWKKYSERGQK